MATLLIPTTPVSPDTVHQGYLLKTSDISKLSKEASKKKLITVEFFDCKSKTVVQRICDVKRRGGKLNLTFETFHRLQDAEKIKNNKEAARAKKEQKTAENTKIALQQNSAGKLWPNEYEMQAMLPTGTPVKDGIEPVSITVENHSTQTDYVVKPILSRDQSQISTSEKNTKLAEFLSIGKTPSIKQQLSKLNSVLSQRSEKLIELVDCNQIEKLKKLLATGINLNVRSFKGYTPLVYAAYKGNTEILQLLIENWADIDYPDSQGITPLKKACRHNHHESTKLLLINGADASIKDNKQWDAMAVTTRYGHHECLSVLLEHKVQQTTSPGAKKPPIALAAQYGHFNCIRLLIDDEANLDEQDVRGWTAVKYASKFNYPECLRILLESGAKADIEDNDGWTAIGNAVYDSHHLCIELLVKYGSDLNKTYPDCNTLLTKTISMSDDDTVELLLRGAADPTTKNKEGKSALERAEQKKMFNALSLMILKVNKLDALNVLKKPALATMAACGDYKCLQHLLSMNANVNVATKTQFSPLKSAVTHENYECAELFLENGAKPDLDSEYGLTALQSAARLGDSRFVKLLLKYGADPKLNSGDSDLPIQIAEQKALEMYEKNSIDINELEGHIESLSLLIQKEDEQEVLNKLKVSPMLSMARHGHLDAIKHLINLRMDLEPRSQKLWSPLQFAVRHEHYDCAKTLLENGAKVDAQTSDGITALHIAVDLEDIRYLVLLLEHNASPFNEDFKKNTPLTRARANAKENETYQQHVTLLVDASLDYMNIENDWVNVPPFLNSVEVVTADNLSTSTYEVD